MTTGYEQHSGDVKDTALSGAAETKDVLMERGGDTVAVAKDELAQLAQEARGHAYNLWSQTSDQLREHALAGTHQLADVLHSLSGELGHLASRSEQNGPVTAFARQASAKGGSFSHWLSNADVDDLMMEVRRFARRRPFAFLVGAATAGVLAGRLSRGLMAGNDTQAMGSSNADARYAMTDRSGMGSMPPAGTTPSFVDNTPVAPVVPVAEPVTGAVRPATPYGETDMPPAPSVPPGGRTTPLTTMAPGEAGYGAPDVLTPDEGSEPR
jgi:hypothetical protein